MMLERFDRITQDPEVMGGKPCIRGMRLTVGRILSQIGAGESIDKHKRFDIFKSRSFYAGSRMGIL